MSPSELQQYLHQHIPLSAAMEVHVESVESDSVILRAPLAPNINHRETVFGGSASALAILSAWSLLHTRLSDESIECRLVIQRNSMEYSKPVSGEVYAKAGLAEEHTWQKFIRILLRRGRARISVLSQLIYQGEVAGAFSGEFVALA